MRGLSRWKISTLGIFRSSAGSVLIPKFNTSQQFSVVDWLVDWLSFHTTCKTNKYKTATLSFATRGNSQGSVLGPLLFKLTLAIICSVLCLFVISCSTFSCHFINSSRTAVPTERKRFTSANQHASLVRKTGEQGLITTALDPRGNKTSRVSPRVFFNAYLKSIEICYLKC